MKEEIKRLFFGVEVHAPWPSALPPGRLLDEKHRHLTLAFLGNVPYSPLSHLLEDFPKVSLKSGSVGYFDSCLILPSKHHPNVVAWHVQWLDPHHPLISFQQILSDWLISHHYAMNHRSWSPHVTLCRQPFEPSTWEKKWTPLPFYTGSIHLYESVGNLNYIPLWSYPLKSPFEEIDHTADMAFIIRGATFQQLYHHAFTALAFKFPEFLPFFLSIESLNSLDEVVMALNAVISRVDSEVGSPLKAVSFHGEVITLQESLLQWEMIVDV